MTEQSSPVPSKPHAPSPLDIPARPGGAKPAPPRPPATSATAGSVPAGSAQAGSAPAGFAQPGAAQPTAGASRPQPQAAPVRVTGAQALVLALEQVGVDVVFGIPGRAVLPAYDPPLHSEPI